MLIDNLTDFPITKVSSDNDSLYYVNAEDSSLYKMSYDRKNNVKLYEGNIISFVPLYSLDKVYCQVNDNQTIKYIVINKDGTIDN